MKSSEVLRKAGDVIRERGWHQGSFCGPNGEVCARGALNVAAEKRAGDAFAVSDNLLALVDETLLGTSELNWDDGLAFVSWNATPGRTVEDVLDLFERAAAVAEESGD